MAGITFRRFRLIYRRSSTLLKCVVLGTILVCLVTLVTIAVKTSQKNQEAEALAEKAALLEQENRTIEEQIALFGTVESTIRIAMEELGLILPDSIIFEPVVPTDPE